MKAGPATRPVARAEKNIRHMTAQGKIIGISLGPGDPQLITVKGLSALQRADKIYYPTTAVSSYSLSILAHYELDKSRLYPVLLEMSADRAHNIGVYLSTFEKMKTD